MTDQPRDAAADLAMCEAATAEPWEVMPEGGWDGDPLERARAIAHPRPELAERFPASSHGPAFREDSVCSAWGMTRENLTFIATARTALPHWIRRCQAAEQRLAKLTAAFGRYSDGDLQRTMDSIAKFMGGDPTP